MAAAYEREATVHALLNAYVRKGNSRSRQCVFVVHRLDRETSGLLVFAKNERVQTVLKDNWKENQKIYWAVVHGRLARKEGIIESYLFEDDKYVVHSIDDPGRGKLARTAYRVLEETGKFTLLEIDLLTGRKNQIRVHFSGEGHALVGDFKYGDPQTRHHRLALHARRMVLVHPVTKERLTFEAPAPEFFSRLLQAGHHIQ